MDTGLNAAFASSDGDALYGFGAFVEPKYNILDNLAIGARIDADVLMRFDVGGVDTGIHQRVASAALAKADFYFTPSKVRPFIAAGAGAYYLGGQNVSATTGDGSGVSINQRAGRYFGVAPQLGVQLGAFRLAATYNIVLGANAEVTQTLTTGMTEVREVSVNYFTIELGGRIGGKRRVRRAPTAEPAPIAKR